MRLLDRAGIRYRVYTYDFDPDDLSAAKVAAVLGVDVNLIYKTLVLRGEPCGVFVCMVAGDEEVDFRKAASAAGCKRASMVPMRDLQPLTGYIRGGCTPVGMKRSYPVIIDRSCLGKDEIYISAGTRGMQLKVAVSDIFSFTGAVVAELTG